jgi:Transposase DDE domain group 1
VSATIRQKLAARKRRIKRRLDKNDLGDCSRPVFTASNIHYDLADRCCGIAYGGIGVMQQIVRQLGLPEAINKHLHVFKIHLPYFESDHVVNIAYNALCEGTCLEDIELRRNDEVFLDALGARRIPDPTTAGDFCRRFDEEKIICLMDAIDEVRLRVWARQPNEFRKLAIIDMDGHIVETTGECKRGMDISYDGRWGYHPLLISLANTREPLCIVNRSGNRPSHDGAACYVDRSINLCFRGGFERVLLRGDTDFSQTEHLDRWNANPRVRFIFGYDSMPNMVKIAQNVPKSAWRRLQRPPHYQVRTTPRQRPEKVKEQVVVDREFENRRLQSEEVAEFSYRPIACSQKYRVVVVRKNISVEKGEKVLFPEIRYFFYITNDRESTAAEIVFLANDRCHQENLIEQLRNGVRALRAPVDTLESNWAYMVMTALAWNLKAWWALLLPEPPGPSAASQRQEKQTVIHMEFKKFVNAFLKLPCQIVHTGRRVVYRLLSWNPWQPIFWRLLEVLRR